MSNSPNFEKALENGKGSIGAQSVSKVSGKKILLPLITVLVGAAAVFGGVSYMKAGVELKDYIVIEGVEGLNGQGTLRYCVDADALADDLFDDEQVERNEDLLAEEFAKYEELWNALDCISVTASSEKGLSNGDSVTVTASFENEREYSFRHRFKDGTVRYTVSGLAEGKTVDPFDESAVSVVFSGFSGTGEARVEVISENKIYEAMDYSLSREEGLCNGDTVMLTVAYSTERLTELGYFAPEETKADYTVSGLTEYFRLEDGFSEEVLEDLRVSALENAWLALAENHNTDYTLVLEPEVEAMYYMAVSDMAEPFHDRFYGLEMINGVAVLSHAIIGNYEFYDNTWHEWNIDVYPNFYWDDSEGLVYNREDVVTYSIHADTFEEAYGLLEEKFGKLDITGVDR